LGRKVCGRKKEIRNGESSKIGIREKREFW
jgi:hypothetical protein